MSAHLQCHTSYARLTCPIDHDRRVNLDPYHMSSWRRLAIGLLVEMLKRREHGHTPRYIHQVTGTIRCTTAQIGVSALYRAHGTIRWPRHYKVTSEVYDFLVRYDPYGNSPRTLTFFRRCLLVLESGGVVPWSVARVPTKRSIFNKS